MFNDWEILELKEEVNTKNTLAVLLQRIGYQSELKMKTTTNRIAINILDYYRYIEKDEFRAIELDKKFIKQKKIIKNT